MMLVGDFNSDIEAMGDMQDLIKKNRAKIRSNDIYSKRKASNYCNLNVLFRILNSFRAFTFTSATGKLRVTLTVTTSYTRAVV